MKRRFNWQLWSGFALSIVAFASYFAFFIRFPSHARLPVAGADSLRDRDRAAGHRTAPRERRRPLAWIVTVLGIGIAAFFCFAVFIGAGNSPLGKRARGRREGAGLHPARHQPQAGRARAASRGAGNKGVILIFYRGYW